MHEQFSKRIATRHRPVQPPVVSRASWITPRLLPAIYERQFITRCNINNDILAYFNQLLEQYLQAEYATKTELRSIEYVHDRIPQSLAYLNDLVRVETGKTLREYVRLKKIDMAKYLVTSSNKTISEIALALGFPNTQTFFCLFKRFVGCFSKRIQTAREQ